MIYEVMREWCGIIFETWLGMLLQNMWLFDMWIWKYDYICIW